jgi:hypothetical protein
MARVEEDFLPFSAPNVVTTDPTSGWERFSFEADLPRLTPHQVQLQIDAARWQAACHARKAYLTNLALQMQLDWLEEQRNTPEPRYSRAAQAKLGFEGHSEFKVAAIAAAAAAIDRALNQKPGRALAEVRNMTEGVTPPKSSEALEVAAGQAVDLIVLHLKERGVNVTLLAEKDLVNYPIIQGDMRKGCCLAVRPLFTRGPASYLVWRGDSQSNVTALHELGHVLDWEERYHQMSHSESTIFRNTWKDEAGANRQALKWLQSSRREYAFHVGLLVFRRKDCLEAMNAVVGAPTRVDVFRYLGEMLFVRNNH